tara:strand:- start:69 stop:254 length:186 start_codon:yes stop_codon:yes gene_type:complete
LLSKENPLRRRGLQVGFLLWRIINYADVLIIKKWILTAVAEEACEESVFATVTLKLPLPCV